MEVFEIFCEEGFYIDFMFFRLLIKLMFVICWVEIIVLLLVFFNWVVLYEFLYVLLYNKDFCWM